MVGFYPIDLLTEAAESSDEFVAQAFAQIL